MIFNLEKWGRNYCLHVCDYTISIECDAKTYYQGIFSDPPAEFKSELFRRLTHLLKGRTFPCDLVDTSGDVYVRRGATITTSSIRAMSQRFDYVNWKKTPVSREIEILEQWAVLELTRLALEKDVAEVRVSFSTDSTDGKSLFMITPSVARQLGRCLMSIGNSENDKARIKVRSDSVAGVMTSVTKPRSPAKRKAAKKAGKKAAMKA